VRDAVCGGGACERGLCARRQRGRPKGGIGFCNPSGPTSLSY
jgi:hypothetical protein